MVGNACDREDSAPEMRGLASAGRSAIVDCDLPLIDVETPCYEISLVDIADTLVGAQFPAVGNE